MPVRVRGFCTLGKYHTIEVEDEVTAYLEYANGATGVFVTTTGEAPGTNRLEIAGDRGKLVAEGDKVTFIRNEVATSEFNRTSPERFARPPSSVSEIAVQGRGGPARRGNAELRGCHPGRRSPHRPGGRGHSLRRVGQRHALFIDDRRHRRYAA